MSPRKVRCCVRNCPATSTEGLTYFSLPIDIDRRLNWLRAIGRPDMTTKDYFKPKSHVVCSIHFDEQQMITLKHTLPDAVPTRYVPRDIKGVFKTCSSIRTQTDFSDSDSDDGNIINDAEIERKRMRVDADVVLNWDSIVEIVPPNIDFENWNKFFEWKDRTTNRRTGDKFDKDFSLFALNLHAVNSRAYKLLMDTWKLPNEEELKAIELKVGPRFDDLMMSLLNQKFQSLLNKGRFCALCLYALKLKPNLYYDATNDDVIGVHNVNGNRSKKAASYALIAMVKGIKVDWSQLLTYSFLSSMTDMDSIDDFIANVLVKLKKMKMNVLALIIPDDECFEKYCKAKKCMSVTRPYVFFDKEILHVVFDVPHLLKRFRDDFITNDFIYKGDIVSWEYIKQVYDLIKDKGGKLLANLNENHFQPDNTDKSMKYPCQIFSKEVASAIDLYADHGILAAQAGSTADFIDKMSEVFDILNLNKMATCDQIKSETQQEICASIQYKALEDGFELFNNLKAMRNGVDTTNELKTIEYFQVSLQSLMNVAIDLQKAYQIGVTRANYFYLEPMLQLLKHFEIDGNGNTPIEFARTFSKLFVKNLIELTTPPASIDNMAEFLKMADNIKHLQTPDPAESMRSIDTDKSLELPDDNGLVYLSSYLLFKCFKFHRCKEFNSHFRNLVDLKEKTNIYGYYENLNKEAEFYNNLKCPTNEFVAYVDRLDDCFLKKFDDFYRTNPAVTIYDALKYVQQCDWPCTCFPKEYLLKLFVCTRINDTVAYNVRCLKEKWISNRSYKLKVKKL